MISCINSYQYYLNRTLTSNESTILSLSLLGMFPSASQASSVVVTNLSATCGPGGRMIQTAPIDRDGPLAVTAVGIPAMAIVQRFASLRKVPAHGARRSGFR